VNDNNHIVSKEEQALKDIRELILINGSHDEWLTTEILKVIEGADYEPTHRLPPAKLWERMIIDGLTGQVTFLPENKEVDLEDVFTYIADEYEDDV